MKVWPVWENTFEPGLEYSFNSPKGIRKLFLFEKIMAGGTGSLNDCLNHYYNQPRRHSPPVISAFIAFHVFKSWSNLLGIAKVVWVSSIRNQLSNFLNEKRICWKEARGFQGIWTTILWKGRAKQGSRYPENQGPSLQCTAFKVTYTSNC